MHWSRPDATLRELVTLVKEVNDSARRPGVKLSLSFVYPDPRGGGYRMREAGTVHSVRAGRDDERSLRSLRFQTGDFLDVAIL
jgi:histone deacetylase complex subunit SAP18